MFGIEPADSIASPRGFRLGTTSFILPDHIIPNVIWLGSFFDEIELLVFESYPLDVLPSKADVKTLFSLAGDLNLTYNIHLPTDVSLSQESPRKRRAAADTLLRVLDRFHPLVPTTHTLHLERPPDVIRDMGNPETRKVWLDRTREGVTAFLSGIPDPSMISVETLDYPFPYMEPLIREFKLSVCLDAGHQIRYGHDLLSTFEAHRSRIPLIHLHGVEGPGPERKDHKALDLLSQEEILKILRILENFRGVVSLEVFNLENLNRSLRLLSGYFQGIPSAIQ